MKSIMMPPTSVVHHSRLVVVAGAKGGVGASVIGALLAGAAAEAEHATLLIEASGAASPLDLLLGLAPGRDDTVSDTATTVLAGLELARVPAIVSSAERRLRLRRLLNSATDAERIVIDAGSRIDEILAACAHASRLLVVSQRDRVGLAAAYAVFKAIGYALPQLDAALVLNGCTAEQGEIASEIVRSAAQHFMGRPVETLAVLPHDPEFAALVESGARLDRLRITELGGAVQNAALAAFAAPMHAQSQSLRIRNG
jgi:MinD-like ATPase involved in chromosome partitioning or flagellar assembly